MNTYKARMNRLVLVPSDGGRFEVSIDGALVYSKLATGKFPEWAQIKREADARLT